MLLQVSSFCALLGLALSAAVPPNLPAFCHGLDCPQFTVINKTADYELRHYEPSHWVSITRESMFRDPVNSEMFMSLFQYIDGANANHVKIPMTAPVLTMVVHGQGPNCASNFTMHFMLPHDQWQSPVLPTNKDVKIVALPAMDVYVKSFPGFAKGTDYTDQVASLYTVLGDKQAHLDTTTFFEAGYNGPYDYANRHNEVWIRKLSSA